VTRKIKSRTMTSEAKHSVTVTKFKNYMVSTTYVVGCSFHLFPYSYNNAWHMERAGTKAFS